MTPLKKWKRDTCISGALKRHHKARSSATDAVGCLKVCVPFLGAGRQGDGRGCSPLCERKVEHSFKHPGVVGRNVLSFNFQSRSFFVQLEFKDSLKNVLFPSLCTPRERTKLDKTARGTGVKHVIHQNKINNERVFLLESAGKKNVCCQLACGDSKHSRAGLEFGLAIICHSCDNACWLQVCGWSHCVYLEMNLKSGWTGKAHNPAK